MCPLTAQPGRTSPTSWTRCTPDQVPAEPGTYAIYIAQKLSYIGSSTNLRARLLRHGFGRRWNAKLGRFTSALPASVKIATDRRSGEHATRELRLIQRLKPPANKNHAH